MPPKEKAIQLANKFITKSVFEMSNEELKEERLKAKKLTLICIEEILGDELCGDSEGCRDDYMAAYREYWTNVRSELNAL